MEAIIVAAGSSRRMGFDKLAAHIAGKSVLAHSLQAFDVCPEVTRILLVCSDPKTENIRQSLGGVSKSCAIIPGGEERADSVRNGLHALSPDCAYVAIHDAARPLILPEQISEALVLAKKNGSCTLAEPCTDTLHRASIDDAYRPHGLLTSTVNREHVWRIQTPQVFQLSLLFAALHQAAKKKTPLTDEASAIIASGHGVSILPCAIPNFKITFPQDLELAEDILSRRFQGDV
ncbi:MAG: 2-C-methyl-D-erythritol 4-phosphate cytidylyltransferase [Chthoniobacterales bacterium]